MPRSISAPLVLSKNTINSTSAFAHLAQIRYRTALPPSETFDSLYFTNYNLPITFNSQMFTPYPISIGEISENSTNETARFQLGVGNIGNVMTDRLTSYWLNIADPLWTVAVWLVDVSQVSETALASKEFYTVLTVTSTLMAATLDCIWVGLGVERRLPGRRFTKLGGYPFIPRVIR